MAKRTAKRGYHTYGQLLVRNPFDTHPRSEEHPLRLTFIEPDVFNAVKEALIAQGYVVSGEFQYMLFRDKDAALDNVRAFCSGPSATPYDDLRKLCAANGCTIKYLRDWIWGLRGDGARGRPEQAKLREYAERKAAELTDKPAVQKWIVDELLSAFPFHGARD